MQQFLVLFREPDGRKDQHRPEEIATHRRHWNLWSEQMNKENRIAGGMPLTLEGRVLRGAGVGYPAIDPGQSLTEVHHMSGGEVPAPSLINGPHQVGEEIIGGYILLNAQDLDEAASLMQICPIFEFGGYAEIREGMTMPAPPNLQEKNKSIVRRFNTSYIQDSDISAFHDIIDPSVINHTAPAGFSKGADGMHDVIELFRKALTGLEVKILRQVAEEDIVVTYKAFHATHTGPLMGIPPSGESVAITIIDIVRLRDGRYVEHWSIRDMSGLRPAS